MLNPTNCHNYTLDRIQLSSYFRNLPRYLPRDTMNKEELCDEIRGRYSETKFSGNIDNRRLMAQLRNKNYYTPVKLKLGKVFYLNHLQSEKIDDYITRVPQIAINGDQHLTLQNGTIINNETKFNETKIVGTKEIGTKELGTKEIGTKEIGTKEMSSFGLLSDVDRRMARKKIIASPVDVYGIGGYPEMNPYIKLSKPYEIIIITAAGAQFENNRLEYQDFVVDKLSHLRQVLFKHYYPHSQGKLADLRTAWHDASNYPPLISGYHLDLRALKISLIEDVYLILKAFHTFIPEGKKGYFHATAIGTGFFANFLMKKNIGGLIMHTILEAYREVLTKKLADFPRLSVIVFPDWSLTGEYTPKNSLFNIAGLEIKASKADVLDFRGVDRLKYVCGAINAGDCFSLPGNEFKYTSVEAMIGNNTDLRIRQNYNWNPFLLERKNQIKITM